MQWIDLPAGWFWMGDGPRTDENPRHRVWLDSFRLARWSVTRTAYESFLAATAAAL